ncbi:(4Fe-4S)-binding protein [Flavilitoribacter nigricans]|uniref:Iron-binding zinc finger CDGSH type domain-containing protein n=1 Tax=Flavilitoribacter nigricans (strain ATCC 23147 / DSM 23189 / NBRC 102662 / NCIMB 1420 / SS-2) TaxID=1122177 RepID=A0A2D0N3H7_FLAN2|nr:(4Fe-4S)-binding protein [Flavilitoribacter nigricans]PHN03054.1 hypothetical protein CRP01_28650 [Flavilitoribacter nigricans DSM 23189 = NBRC 102662]
MSNDKPTVKEYSNGEITVVWQPDKCIHSKMCFNGLPQVFDPQARPWVNVEGASSQEIMKQIKKCPSGALSYYVNDDSEVEKPEIDVDRIVEVVENGPLMVFGNLTVKHHNGEVSHEHRTTAFCRCGGSSNKPYCDGTHKKIGFTG